MANKPIGEQPQAPQAIPRSTRSDSTEGVGLLMPWALAVAAPRAVFFTTMRARQSPVFFAGCPSTGCRPGAKLGTKPFHFPSARGRFPAFFREFLDLLDHGSVPEGLNSKQEWCRKQHLTVSKPASSTLTKPTRTTSGMLNMRNEGPDSKRRRIEEIPIDDDMSARLQNRQSPLDLVKCRSSLDPCELPPAPELSEVDEQSDQPEPSLEPEPPTVFRPPPGSESFQQQRLRLDRQETCPLNHVDSSPCTLMTCWVQVIEAAQPTLQLSVA